MHLHERALVPITTYPVIPLRIKDTSLRSVTGNCGRWRAVRWLVTEQYLLRLSGRSDQARLRQVANHFAEQFGIACVVPIDRALQAQRIFRMGMRLIELDHQWSALRRLVLVRLRLTDIGSPPHPYAARRRLRWVPVRLRTTSGAMIRRRRKQAPDQ